MGGRFAASISPVEFVFWRWLLAASFMLALFWRQVVRELPVLLGAAPLMLGLAVLGSLGSNGLGYWALHYTSAVNVAIVSSSMPAMVYVLNVLFGAAPPRAWAMLGVAVSTAGVLILYLVDQALPAAAEGLAGGIALAILSNLAWAFYSVVTGRRKPDVSQRSFAVGLALCSVLVCSPFMLLQFLWGTTMQFDGPNAAALLHAGIAVSVFGYLLYNISITTLGARAASMFMHLIPLLTVLFTAALDRTLPSLQQVTGLILVLTGVLAVINAEKKIAKI